MSSSRKSRLKSDKHATKNPFSQFRNEVSLEYVIMRAMGRISQHALYVVARPATARRSNLVSEDKLKQLRRRRKRARVAASVRPPIPIPIAT